MGSIDLVVTDDPQQSYSIYSITDIACTGYDTVDGNKNIGRKTLTIPSQVKLCLLTMWTDMQSL